MATGVTTFKRGSPVKDINSISRDIDFLISQLNATNVTENVLTAVADDELLSYDSGNGYWINRTAAEAGLLYPVSITAAASGDYIRHNGTNFVDVTIAQIITDLALDDIIGGSGIDVTNGADTIIGGNATLALGALSGDWDAGSHKIIAEQLESDVAGGTAPLIVASTTLVDNLNADTVDGVELAELLQRDGTVALTAAYGSDWSLGTNSLLFGTFGSEDVEVKQWAANKWGSVDWLGIGVTPLALLHVYDGASGQGTPASNTKLLIEDNSHAYLGFLTPNSAVQGIKFGDPENNAMGSFDYNHSTDTFRILVGGNREWKFTGGGQAQFLAPGSEAGILCGGDALWYRSAADTWRTPDSVLIDGTLTVGTAADYTTSNVVTDRAFDADSTDVAELADVLGSVIADLITAGIFQ